MFRLAEEKHLEIEDCHDSHVKRPQQVLVAKKSYTAIGHRVWQYCWPTKNLY